MQQLTAHDIRQDITEIQEGRLSSSLFRFDLAGTLWTVELEPGAETNDEPFIDSHGDYRVNVRYYIGTEDAPVSNTNTRSPTNDGAETLEAILAGYPVDKLNRSEVNSDPPFHLHGDDRGLEEWVEDEVGEQSMYSTQDYVSEFGVGPVETHTLATTTVELLGMVCELEVQLKRRDRLNVVFRDPNGYEWRHESTSLPGTDTLDSYTIANRMKEAALKGLREYIVNHPATFVDPADGVSEAAELQFHR